MQFHCRFLKLLFLSITFSITFSNVRILFICFYFCNMIQNIHIGYFLFACNIAIGVYTIILLLLQYCSFELLTISKGSYVCYFVIIDLWRGVTNTTYKKAENAEWAVNRIQIYQWKSARTIFRRTKSLLEKIEEGTSKVQFK